MDNLITYIKQPCKVVDKSYNVSSEDNLLIAKESQIGLSEKSVTNIDGTGFLVLDYGCEVCGGAEISVFVMNSPSARVRLRFGESLSEVYSQIGEKGASNDHSLRDFEILLVSYSKMCFGQTGFRFLRLDFIDDISIDIKSVNAKHTRHDSAPIFTYSGKDSVVNDIFVTAKNTIDLCMQEYLWDGIKRDRLVWIGDIHPEMLAITTLYGRHTIIEKSLNYIRNQTPPDKWMNNMPSYSLWWIIILADYCTVAECPDYLAQNLDYLQELIHNIDKHIGSNGELMFPSLFVDWQTRGQADEECGVRAICITALKKAVDIQIAMERPCEFTQALLARVGSVNMYVHESKQVVALKYWATNKLDEREIALLIKDGASGFSTFMSFYILNAIAKTSGVSVAVELMKEYYQGMLERGATTFWEDFSIEWLRGSGRIDTLPDNGLKDIHGDYGAYCYKGFRHSLCHGWSAGVIKFIKNYC